MRRILVFVVASLSLMMSWIDSSYALDSYRYLHVTIETPWIIFLFLLMGIFAPFVLMGTLIWRYAERKPTLEEQPDSIEDSKE